MGALPALVHVLFMFRRFLHGSPPLRRSHLPVHGAGTRKRTSWRRASAGDPSVLAGVGRAAMSREFGQRLGCMDQFLGYTPAYLRSAPKDN